MTDSNLPSIIKSPSPPPSEELLPSNEILTEINETDKSSVESPSLTNRFKKAVSAISARLKCETRNSFYH
jgi:hypothetical protein